ncbi:ATP-binding protein [Streptomyces echinoruber]|uniref:ATPase n=1 Tax=Streptomyces echinoruber TaxID=68898 RepID=A0A918S1Q3_9ACTN|nr:ATP-binding protein [Streptomyces echinoruber]GHA17754.1 ATPase [Streptomyces echinoruber]
MPLPLRHALRPPTETAGRAGEADTFGGFPQPGRSAAPGRGATRPPGAPSAEDEPARARAVPRVPCSGRGFARARAFTRDTLRHWPPGHRGDDVTLVRTELATNAVRHAVPRTAPDGTHEAHGSGAADLRLGPAPHTAHLVLTVSDPGDDPLARRSRRLRAGGARPQPGHRGRPGRRVGRLPTPPADKSLRAVPACRRPIPHLT